MKVYKDIDEVIKPTEVPKELWKMEEEMKKIPNFDHITKVGKKFRKIKKKNYNHY